MTNRIKFAFLTVVLAACISQVALGQHNPSGVFTPLATSLTAASKCGITVEQLRSEGYNHKYTFTADSPALAWVEGCSEGRLFRDTHGHSVAAGSVGYLKAKNSAEVAFTGTCNNRAMLAEVVKADEAETADLTPAEPPTTTAEQVVRSERTEPAPATTNNTEFTSAPMIGDYVPINRRATTVVNNNLTTNVVNTNTLTSTTVVNNLKPKGEGWCQTYTPGPRTLYVGGWIGQQFKCHPKRTTMVLLGAAAAVPGIAYATNSLWWATNNGNGNNGNNGNGNNGTIYGYPISDWEAGPCSLWAQGGKYFGRRPIPARCF